MTFQSRVTRGGTSTSIKGFPGAAPQWIRLVRSGNTFTGYYSANGTAWTLMGSATVAMTAQVYIGLALTSHNPRLRTSATFTDVALTVERRDRPDVRGDRQRLRATTTAQAVSGAGSVCDQRAARRRARSVDSDYDGDGRADLAGYRPSTGEWQVLTSGARLQKTVVTRWGTASDLRVPGDYDGDGKTDLAVLSAVHRNVVDPRIEHGYATNVDVWLGPDAGVPVPGDYDGDGMTDVAVYSPASGQWRILKSSDRYPAEIVRCRGRARIVRRLVTTTATAEPISPSTSRPQASGTSCSRAPTTRQTSRSGSGSAPTYPCRPTTMATASPTRQCSSPPPARGWCDHRPRAQADCLRIGRGRLTFRCQGLRRRRQSRPLDIPRRHLADSVFEQELRVRGEHYIGPRHRRACVRTSIVLHACARSQ